MSHFSRVLWRIQVDLISPKSALCFLCCLVAICWALGACEMRHMLKSTRTILRVAGAQELPVEREEEQRSVQ